MFNNDATISGNPGVITMCVSDKEGKFSRDTQKISLKPGQSVFFFCCQGVINISCVQSA